MHHVLVRHGNAMSVRDGVFVGVFSPFLCGSNSLRFDDYVRDLALNIKDSLFSFQFQTNHLAQGRLQL